MSDLDDKLREILEARDEVDVYAGDYDAQRTIPMIKKAFANDGYMTGQEWYDRFLAEIDKINKTMDAEAEIAKYKSIGFKLPEAAVTYAVVKLEEAVRIASGINVD